VIGLSAAVSETGLSLDAETDSLPGDHLDDGREPRHSPPLPPGTKCTRKPRGSTELEQLGLRPGTVLTIERRNSASSLSVRLPGGAAPIRISLDLADCISVIARAA
jgi:hypothetical protein